MWVLIVSAWFIVPPVNEPRALLVGLFPTAKACMEAKVEVDTNFRAEANKSRGQLASWGTACVEVKTNNVPTPEPASKT